MIETIADVAKNCAIIAFSTVVVFCCAACIASIVDGALCSSKKKLNYKENKDEQN